MADTHEQTQDQRRRTDAEGKARLPAEVHYSEGNRLFEADQWENASAQWRRAQQFFQARHRPPPPAGRRFVQLRAALALVATAFLIHQLLFVFFPRNPIDLILLSGESGGTRSWLERWLETGRPQPTDNHKMNFREWWLRLKEKEGTAAREQGQGRGMRPPMPERWANLLRRYGRWGEFYTWNLDFSVISGNGLSRLGDFQGAAEVLEAGIKRNRDPEKLADMYQGLANAYYYSGYELHADGLATYDLGKVSKAARAYEQSLKYGQRSLSYGNLGWMFYLLGDYRKAEDYSRKALLANDQLHYVRLNLGLIHMSQGRLRESFEDYISVLKRDPGPEVYLGGINDLREVLRDNPGRFPFAYLLAGVLAVKSGDLTQAREFLTRFLAGPSQGDRWKQLATALLRSLDFSELKR